MKLKVLDLFSGIGGFSLGLERTGGFKTVAFCEIEECPRKILNKHWPGVPIYEDVRELTAERLLSDGIRPNVITGGFPCQDLSVAGNQAGITAERSGLWTELARLIGEIRPKYAIVENVTALLSGERGRWFQRVLGDLAEIGYDTEWHCIPASELGAHHHRDRVWIVCYSTSDRRRFTESTYNRCDMVWNILEKKEWKQNADQVTRSSENVADTNSERLQVPILREFGGFREKERAFQGSESSGADAEKWRTWDVEPDVGRVANGIPRRVDRLKGLGNAVVPQIPELIGRAILEAEKRGMCE